jgi:hypothetical protein
MKRDRHSEIVEQRARKSASYRKTFARGLHQTDLAHLVRAVRVVRRVVTSCGSSFLLAVFFAPGAFTTP